MNTGAVQELQQLQQQKQHQLQLQQLQNDNTSAAGTPICALSDVMAVNHIKNDSTFSSSDLSSVSSSSSAYLSSSYSSSSLWLSAGGQWYPNFQGDGHVPENLINSTGSPSLVMLQQPPPPTTISTSISKEGPRDHPLDMKASSSSSSSTTPKSSSTSLSGSSLLLYHPEYHQRRPPMVQVYDQACTTSLVDAIYHTTIDDDDDDAVSASMTNNPTAETTTATGKNIPRAGTTTTRRFSSSPRPWGTYVTLAELQNFSFSASSSSTTTRGGEGGGEGGPSGVIVSNRKSVLRQQQKEQYRHHLACEAVKQFLHHAIRTTNPPTFAYKSISGTTNTNTTNEFHPISLSSLPYSSMLDWNENNSSTTSIPNTSTIHGVAVWCLPAKEGSSVSYHMDYAEQVRYQYNIIVPPIIAGTLHCSPIHAMESISTSSSSNNHTGSNTNDGNKNDNSPMTLPQQHHHHHGDDTSPNMEDVQKDSEEDNKIWMNIKGGSYCVYVGTDALEQYQYHGYKGCKSHYTEQDFLHSPSPSKASSNHVLQENRNNDMNHATTTTTSTTGGIMVQIPYQYNRMILHTGHLPHFSTKIQKLTPIHQNHHLERTNERNDSTTTTTTTAITQNDTNNTDDRCYYRVIMGFNVFLSDVGPFVQAAPEHSSAFVRKVQMERWLFQKANSMILSSSSKREQRQQNSGNSTANTKEEDTVSSSNIDKPIMGFTHSMIQQNRPLMKLLILAKREKVKQDFIQAQKVLTDQIISYIKRLSSSSSKLKRKPIDSRYNKDQQQQLHAQLITGSFTNFRYDDESNWREDNSSGDGVIVNHHASVDCGNHATNQNDNGHFNDVTLDIVDGYDDVEGVTVQHLMDVFGRTDGLWPNAVDVHVHVHHACHQGEWLSMINPLRKSRPTSTIPVGTCKDNSNNSELPVLNTKELIAPWSKVQLIDAT